jgi:tRNA G46 methylase TrmB
MKPENKVKRIEDLWTKSTTDLNSYSFNWDKGVKLFSSDGFGEVTANFCLFMVEIHAKHSRVPFHSQTFVDIGSGLAKAVCQVATLQPNFNSCFGIELQEDRSCHSTEITASFAKEALRALVPFCRISLVQGDCLQNPLLRHKLSRAGLIFINNEIFSIELNQVKMTFTLTP